MAGREAQISAVTCRGLVRRYGSVLALRGIDLDVRAGTVHALVGQNGAGKSTCLGIVAGRTGPTAGQVEIFGEPLRAGDPRWARAVGVHAVYQELTIVPAVTTQANVYLGATITHRGLLREDKMRAGFRDLCERLSVEIPLDVPAGTLPVASQQLLEIMRGLHGNPRLLLLDEPTAALAAAERETLFRVVRDLRGHGVTIMFVSHNLDDVLGIADHITVFRDGSVVEDEEVGGWNKARLVAAMVGDSDSGANGSSVSPGNGGPSSGASPIVRGAAVEQSAHHEVLRIEELTVPGAVENISLSLSSGELLGLGGLVGSGRTTVLQALAGLTPTATGRLWIDGTERPLPRSPQHALELGIALIPEDRKRAGIVGAASAATNIVMSDFRSCTRLGFLQTARVRASAESAGNNVGFASQRLNEPARNLSGGNQQKLLLARWSHRRVKILLADEPTRGIDIHAKSEIANTLRTQAAAGMAVVVVSSELEDLVDLCDRVVVLSEGHVAGELSRERDEITVNAILASAFRATSDQVEGGIGNSRH